MNASTINHAPPAEASAPPPWGRMVAFSLAYFACAVAGRAFALQPGSFINFWLPSGLFVTTLLRHETRHWPLLVLAAFPANVGFDLLNQQAAPISLLFCCANCLEALTGAWLVRRFIAARPDLSSLREMAGLIGLSALFSTALGATVGASVVTGLLGSGTWGGNWLLWWSGDALGILLLAPLILAWQTNAPMSRPWRASLQWAEAGVFMAVLCLTAVYVFRDDWHRNVALKYAMIPFVMGAAFRFGLPGVAITNLMVAIFASWFTVQGFSDIATVGLIPREQVAALQLYLAMVALTGLFMAAALAERAKAEAVLRESEADLRALLNATTQSAFLLDRQGTVLTANEISARRLGRTSKEILGANILQCLPPEIVAARKARLEQVVASGQPLRFEDVRSGRLLDQSLVPILDPAGQVVRVAVFAEDITDRRQAEEEVRKNDQLLARSQAIAQVGSWELALEGNRLTWSDEVYRIFELEPRLFTPTYEGFLEIVHSEDRARVDATYQTSIREAGNTYEIEHRVVRKSTGEVRHVHEKCEHVRDASGRVVRSIGMVQDITDRRAAEERIKDQLTELQRWQAVMLDREDRVQELKREVNELCRRAGETVRYPSQLANPPAAGPEGRGS